MKYILTVKKILVVPVKELVEKKRTNVGSNITRLAESKIKDVVRRFILVRIYKSFPTTK